MGEYGLFCFRMYAKMTSSTSSVDTLSVLSAFAAFALPFAGAAPASFSFAALACAGRGHGLEGADG